MADIESIGKIIVNSAYRISSKLGPGLVESVYERVFARDLSRSGLSVERQKWISFEFEGMWFENALRLDLLVERCVAIEVKSAKDPHPEHYKQLLSYMRLAEVKLGFLINFGSPRLTIKRLVNRM